MCISYVYIQLVTCSKMVVAYMCAHRAPWNTPVHFRRLQRLSAAAGPAWVKRDMKKSSQVWIWIWSPSVTSRVHLPNL